MATPLPVIVIEEHTEGLECMSLAVRRHLVSAAGCHLVHFDSHPDLGCLECLEPEDIIERADVCHKLRNSEDGISSFILPAVTMKIVSTVSWVRPTWSNQIPDGKYFLHVGWASKIFRSAGNEEADALLDQRTKHCTKVCTVEASDYGGSREPRLRVVTDLPYWVDDGAAAVDVSDLRDAVSFDLLVGTLPDWLLLQPKNGNSWILDVCLDYFTCANPLNEPDLPCHISSEQEIETMMAEFGMALARHQYSVGSTPPALCIIARSEEDGFTPKQIATELEVACVKVLQDVYGNVQVHNVSSHEDFYNPKFIRKI